MRTREASQSFTAATPAAASTVVDTNRYVNLWRFEYLTIDAKITGGTGGTLDVYLQRKLASNSWADWVHFPQVAAGVTKQYTLSINGADTSIIEEGVGTDASPGVVLAANTSVNVIPTGDVRMVFVAGAGTSVAGSVTLTISPFSELY